MSEDSGNQKKCIKPEQIYATTELNLKKFLQEKRWWDALLLYFAYQQQSRYQKTNQSRSTDIFMMKKLGWGKQRLSTAKMILKRMWYIEILPSRKKWLIDCWYVKVNYMMNLEDEKYKNHQKQDSGEWDTNAWNNPKEKCLKEKKDDTSNKFDVLLSSYWLSREFIEDNFEHKKKLEELIYDCQVIDYVSRELDILPVYDRETINGTDIMIRKWYSAQDILDFIEEWDWASSVENYKELMREDYYLPAEIGTRL